MSVRSITLLYKTRMRVQWNRYGMFVYLQYLEYMLSSVFRRSINPKTVRNRLYGIGFKARRPKKGLTLTQRHRLQRHQWSTRHLRMNRRQWGRILFSDESKVNVSRLDGRVRVWRARGERLTDNCIQQYNRWGGSSVHIWGGISQFGRTNLVFLDRNVNAAMYVNDVLRPEAVPFLRRNFFSMIMLDPTSPNTQLLSWETMVFRWWTGHPCLQIFLR